MSSGGAKLALVPLLLMGALAVRQLSLGLRGPFLGPSLLAAAALLAVGAAAAWHLASGRGVAAIRRGAWLSALITLVLVVDCSATGVVSTRGMGYQMALADPGVYLATLLPLVGPLLVALLLPALLASRRRVAIIASVASAVLALVTLQAAMIVSFSGICSRFFGQGGEPACITAATGGVAGFFGLFGILLVLPFAAEERPPGA